MKALHWRLGPVRTYDPGTMASSWWHDGELAVQTRAGVTHHDRLRGGVRDALPPHFAAFLEVQRFIVAATRDAAGSLWCSMILGWPGFASASTPSEVSLDRRAFEDDPILEHLTQDPRIGILAFDPSTRRRIRVNGTASIRADEIVVAIAETFGNCRQYIQQRPAAGPVPQRYRTVSAQGAMSPDHVRWVAGADTCFLATMHDEAGFDASHRGGRPGFVEVLDERTVRFADYPGNDMFQTLGNLAANPAAGMLFVDFVTGASLQMTGHAAVEWDERASPTGRFVRVTADALVEKRPQTAWDWPVLEYSPVNPER